MNALRADYLIATAVLIAIGIIGVVLSYGECKRHDEPVKTLARTLCESVVIFSFGTSVGVVLTVTRSKGFWVLMAVSATMGYLILMVSILRVLRKLGERKKATVAKFSVPPAMLIESPSNALKFLQALYRYTGIPIMVVSREPYEEWVKRTGMIPREYAWLTRMGYEIGIDPTRLHVLAERVARFFRENPGGIVYLDGIEYLLFYNEFRGLMRFLIALKDMAILHGGHVVLSVDPRTLEEEELLVLGKEFERVEVEPLLRETLGFALSKVLSSGAKVAGDASAESPERES